jgi:ankyrin repeat protein
MESAQRLQQAIAADDRAVACALVEAEPSLLEVAIAGGASAILLALYMGKQALAEAIAQRKPALAITESAALGRSDALLAALASDPAAANARSGDGFPALGLAVFFGHFKCAALLLGAGADADAAAANPMRVAPIHSACARSDEAQACALAQLLLAFGANPNARQQAGWTPLHAAAHRDQARLIRLLREAGADTSLCNEAGVDPIALAASEGRHAALAALQA